MSSVADALTASRDAHMRYHVASGEIFRDGTLKRHPHEPARVVAIQAALDARLAAEAADPAHADPAWAEDQSANRGVSSSDLLLFYTGFLGMP